MAEVKTYSDAACLAQGVAQHLVTLAAEAIADHDRFTVAFSGGSTPRAAYALLATEDYIPHINWSRVHIFWGDERCVTPDHPDSNYRMARETLLDHVPIPAENVHRMHGEMEPEAAAEEYERVLRLFFAQRCGGADKGGHEPVPRFDLMLLGMGQDGHTASLFPNTEALGEQTRWVVAQYVNKLKAWRMTLTPVAINSAAHIWIVVSGAKKAERLRQVLTGAHQAEMLPVQLIKPAQGHLLWMADASAMALL
jgi:6-phosphogluconolactonase